MSEEERRVLLEGMDLKAGDVRMGGAFAATAVIAGGLGGFGTYQLAVIVANMVARAILGRGLALAGNAALTRALGVALGPVGWIASGAWLVYDLGGPAYRKTLPAVVQVAALRQVTTQREFVGVMGHGSTGKDSLLQHLFGVRTGEIDPIPGSTSAARLYDASTTKRPVRVLNFPGFGDLRPEVDAKVHELAQHSSVLLYLFNGSEIPKRAEIEEFERYTNRLGRNGKVAVIPLLNKWDRADDDERQAILEETQKRLGRRDVVCTSFKPKPGNSWYEAGIEALRARLNDWAKGNHSAPMF